MFNRMKVVTSLLLVLVLFGALQLVSGGLFFTSLKDNKENFTVLQTIRQQQSELNESWVNLLQTRNTLNRAGIRYMMDLNKAGTGATVDELLVSAKNTLSMAEQHYAAYEKIPLDARQDAAAADELKQRYTTLHTALSELIPLLGDGKLDAFFEQPTQRYQTEFEQLYNRYLTQNDKLYQIAVEDGDSSFEFAVWTLGVVLVLVVAVIAMVWFGIHHILVRPLNRMIEHIKLIAAGDLTHQIDVNSRNEMGVLAASLRHMQGELIDTVSGVRQGADAIYSGASEIAAGNNDLFPYRTAGRLVGRNRRQHGTVDRDGETERRKCPSGQPTGVERLRNRAERRQSGRQRGANHARHRWQLAEDCRYYQRDRRYRLPDQHPGVECGSRSCPCR